MISDEITGFIAFQIPNRSIFPDRDNEIGINAVAQFETDIVTASENRRANECKFVGKEKSGGFGREICLGFQFVAKHFSGFKNEIILVVVPERDEGI
jgi:hypothetical protein